MAETDILPILEDHISQSIDDEVEDDVSTQFEGGGKEEQEIRTGTILEAAFVNPAYPWPPSEGMQNLDRQLSKILDADDNASVSISNGEGTVDTEEDSPSLGSNPAEDHDGGKIQKEEKSNMTSVTTATTKSSSATKKKKKGLWNCCKADDAVVVLAPEAPVIEEEQLPVICLSAEEKEVIEKEQAAVTVEQFHRARSNVAEDKNYSRVPEGILVYRLDTSTKTLTLISEPGKDTDESTLVKKMVIARVRPASGASRRAIHVIGIDGTETTLVACEQRTAVAWHEAMDMMIANEGRGIMPSAGQMVKSKSRIWSKCNLEEGQRNRIEEEYLVLASYSNKLVRTCSVPGQKNSPGVGGIYYSVETQKEPGESYKEENLESISKRRAVILDSWDFYRMVCSLVRDRRKYDEIFHKIRKDPVYPYFNSLAGMNDNSGEMKPVGQREYSDYPSLTNSQLADKLIADAEEVKPSLLAVCKKFAATFGLKEIGVGPIKTKEAALKKAERKYQGDLLKVTDYCRALLVVKDIPALLALLEHARDSFGELISRVKLSPLQDEHEPIIGGYRDVKINVEINGHVCEIQVHIWSMWSVCGVDGYKHYRHAIEYNTDSFKDPYRALDGLDHKAVAELTVMAEETIAEVPLENLEWHHESKILDYSAEVGLFMKHNLFQWAETTLKKIIELRLESPDIGPYHLETLSLYESLEKCLNAQDKKRDAGEVREMIEEIELTRGKKEEEAEKSRWDYLNVCHVINPNYTDEQDRAERKKEIKASKKCWRKIRSQRYPYLHSPLLNDSRAASEVNSRYTPSAQSFCDPYGEDDLEFANRMMTHDSSQPKYDL